jgi:hypothetical protein
MVRRVFGMMAVVVVVMGLGGCWQQGATQKALFTLDKTKRTLIWVDPDPSVTPPAGWTTEVAEDIARDLFKYQALDRVVSQSRLQELQKNQERFGKMGIADVARETGADQVLYVRVVTLNITTSSDEALTQGSAQVLVKVIDSAGKRVWPPEDLEGTEVDASVMPEFSERQDKVKVAMYLRQDLVRGIGRLFHDWLKNESTMRRPE